MPPGFSDWFEKTHPELTGSGLWLRGGELNTVALEEWDKRKFRVLFTRLSTYADTAASFAHLLLYQLAARMDGVFPDLAYLPPRADIPIFARDRIPWLLGSQSKQGPEAFQLLGFSLSIVQELINLPSMLSRSGIPLGKKERLARPELPLVLLGGASAAYSTALWNDDPQVDGIFVGEDPAAIRRLLEICREGQDAGLSKREILARASELECFLEPDRPRRIKKSIVLDLGRSEALTEGPVLYDSETAGSAPLQISEGCPCFCSFCAESWDRKPYRERSAEEALAVALAAKARMGLDQVDVYSFNFNMHSEFYRLLWDLVPLFRGLGLKSQRFDVLAHDPQMAEFQHAVEKASFTCGLEGISARLRRYLGKNLKDEELERSLSAIFRSKARELKVFLIATGQESPEDFAEFENFLTRLGKLRSQQHSGARLVFSMTPLVRFPATPLEFEPAHPVAHYDRIIRRVGGAVRKAGFEFREAAELPEYYVSQLLVRAADPRVGQALAAAVERTGFVYHRAVSESFAAELDRTLEERGLSGDELLSGFSLAESASKPWTLVDLGVRREYLWERLQKARAFEEEGYCLGRSWEKGKCFHCGGCPTRFHVRDIVLATQEREQGLEAFKNRVREVRASEVQVSVLVDLGERVRGLPRKSAAVAVARALMLADPALARAYRGFRGSYWEDGEAPVWMEGLDVFRLVFLREGVEALERVLSSRPEMGKWGRVLGLAPEGWAPRAIEAVSPFRPQVDKYLRARDLKHTLRKIPTGGYSFELIPQAVKKGILLRAEVDASVPARVLLAPGRKFLAEEAGKFLHEAFALPCAAEAIRTRIRAD